MIYIVEIPHMSPPACWSRSTKDEVIGVIEEVFSRSDTLPPDDFQGCIDYNGEDLSSQRVYMTDDEAVEAFKDSSEWEIHGGVDARTALRKQLLSNDCEF